MSIFNKKALIPLLAIPLVLIISVIAIIGLGILFKLIVFAIVDLVKWAAILGVILLLGWLAIKFLIKNIKGRKKR